MEGCDPVISTPLQKLRLKYYWQGVVMHDMVSLVGDSNILYANSPIKKSPCPPDNDFYYVTRQSITNGHIDYKSTPIKNNCTRRYLERYRLDSRCIIISGDSHRFSAMTIQNDAIDIPVVLGRESFAIRFSTPEDAVTVHAWLLSDEISTAIRATLRDRATMLNKHSAKIEIGDLKQIPVPSLNWLRNNYSQGSLKAKCVGLSNKIVMSLQGASVNDPIYGDMVGILENAVSKIGCADSV